MSGYRRRVSTGRGSRWMDLRYAGVCKVCGREVGKGERAYWDQAARTVTCERIECASADGLTETQYPTDPWDKFESREVLRESRIGAHENQLATGAQHVRHLVERCVDVGKVVLVP